MSRRNNNNNRNRGNGRPDSKGATSTGTLKDAEDGSIEDKPTKSRGSRNKKNNKYDQVAKQDLPNDPDDYFTDASIAEQAAQLSIPNVLGTKQYLQNFRMPTCMILPVNPSIGVSQFEHDDEGDKYVSSNSGAFMASQKLYTLASINSGRSGNYQQNDVLCAVLAVSEAVGLVEHMRRMFGIATTYSMRNRIYAIRLLSMLGNQRCADVNWNNFTFGEDFIQNMSNYRLQLNMAITKINQIPIIANMGWIRKKIRIFQRVFLDSPTDLAQTYALTPWSTWWLDETGETGSVLRTLHLHSNTYRHYGDDRDDEYVWTFADLLKVLNKQVDALLNSTTLNYVYGDLLNYAAKAKMEFLRLDYVQEGYSVIPEYNAFYNYMIHNADYVDSPQKYTNSTDPENKLVFTNDNDVITDATSGSFFYAPAFQVISSEDAQEYSNFFSVGGWKINPILDLANNNPSLAEKIDYTKFKITFAMHARGNVGGYTDIFVQGNALPDHYIVSPVIYFEDPDSYIALTHTIMTNNSQGVRLWSGWQHINIPESKGVSDILNEFTMYNPEIVVELLEKWGMATPLRWRTKFISPDPSVSSSADVGVQFIGGECDFVTDIPYDRFAILTDLEYQGLLEFRG